MIFEIFQHKPHLRYWIFALRSIFWRNTGCGMLPNKYAKKWFSVEGNCTIFSSSAVLLQWRSKFWKLAWVHVAVYFRVKHRTQLENSVSKMGFMLPDLKNHSKSVRTFRLKNGKPWCLANERFFFVLISWKSKHLNCY